jgi:hypothetical protein
MYAQERRVQWKRTAEVKEKVELLHSVHVINLPTTTSLLRGEFEYEISHRFLPPLNTEKAFLGIDGPANIRMALAYGITDKTLLTLARSNLQDNVDLRVKYRFWELNHDTAPAALALRAGGAWNTQVNPFLSDNRKTADPKNVQYYGQVVLNTLILKKLGIGLVPSYLYNSDIYSDDTETSFTLGTFLQYYVGPMWSVIIEGNTTISGYKSSYNSLHFGIELETGGHFFKIFVGNNAALNPSQYLAGSDMKTDMDSLRVGFNITRILKL